MNACDYWLTQIPKYAKNHYMYFRLKKNIDEHISGLKVTANKMRGTRVGIICSRDANRYQKLLDLAVNGDGN